MRRVSIVIAICFVLALALSLMGQARTLDTIMKEIQPVWATPATGLNANLNSATPDYAKVAADAAKLEALFKEAEGEFNKLKMTDAASKAKGAAEASGKLAAEAKTGKVADAKAHTAALNQCKACHSQYREPDPAGGFKVKAQ